MNERTRLQWQCRRGMLELDLLLQSFLDHGYDRLDAEARQAFDQLLDYPDQLLLEYLMELSQPLDARIAHVIKCIRQTAAA
ncbi:MAG: succinate dehydrogenase assembly factor 2 [Pseudomonadota bacterium]